MTFSHQPMHWLDGYASSRYHWQALKPDSPLSRVDCKSFHRPQGNVESSFDSDGRYWEGRADLVTHVRLNIRSSLTEDNLRERLVLAWACLRCTHWLISSRSPPFSQGFRPHFIVDISQSFDDAVAAARVSVDFLEDTSPGTSIDADDLQRHVVNAARVFNPNQSLARLFVLPSLLVNDRRELRLVIVGAHQIWDGLSNFVAIRDLITMLNLPPEQLRERIESAIHSTDIVGLLPLPQEALYPRIHGSRARQRWFWLLTRILRHVRKPLAAAFPNPLLRRTGRKRFLTLPSTYAATLDYHRAPPLATANIHARASLSATQRLHRLCRQANVSIGAGSFALAALIQMEMYEQEYPNICPSDRRPFISGFPLNPRAFFNHHADPNSVMLAFCDGILLPFLPSHLPLEGRLRLLARHAHRQLSAFQKRRAHQPVESMTRAEALRFMGSRGPGRVLANQYLGSIERAESLLPPELRSESLAEGGAQGQYPARLNETPATCNISSVGNVEAFRQFGLHDLEAESKDFAADLVDSWGGVRARENEFLVGVGGDARGLWADVSLDASAMDPLLVAQWKRRFETILDDDLHQSDFVSGKL